MTATNFLGIPVTGRITRIERVPQRPLSELRPLVQALLDDDRIVEFGWRQYTPYFNDGEPCVFSAAGFWVRTDADRPEADEADLELGPYAEPHPTLGDVPAPYRVRAEDHPYTGDDEPRYRRCRALADALASDAWTDVLAEVFGDHAAITVRRTGIAVEFYEHG